MIQKDLADNKFIECAVALNAEVIITGDKSLEALGEYMGIKIFKPKKFIERYKF